MLMQTYRTARDYHQIMQGQPETLNKLFWRSLQGKICHTRV